jgi:hypothetical protein
MAVQMPNLSETIEIFAQRACNLADAELERPWVWQDYKEGVRFAFFRTYEELRELAARLHAQRSASPAMPLEFRLHRFDSHLRQHTIQAEKTLAGIGAQPNETRRLLRQMYAALAELESVQIGASGFGAQSIQALAAQISQRLEEIFPVKV